MTWQSSCEEDYIGDVEILRLLEESHQAFEAGDKSALMMCVFRCAAFQAVIPEWATDALIALRENLENGRISDFNAAFGIPTEKTNTRAAKARIKKMVPLVLAEILQLRTAGLTFSATDISPQVVENLSKRGFNINERDVQTIYKNDGQFLKAIPRGLDPKGGHGFAILTMPRARRRGRNILRD
jgi:hypothetical protein